MEKKQYVRLAVCGTTAIVVVAAAAINHYLTAKNDVPLPFAQQQGSSLAGDLTKIGRSVADVYKVTFPEGVDHEALTNNQIYLVYVPDEDRVPNVPLDDILTLEDGSHDVNYFGYKYLSIDAATEREHRNDPLLKDRFPGQFFASHKARMGDGTVDQFAGFESNNNVVMSPTDAADGNAKLERNSLYFLIVNEEGPVTITVRKPASCGDGVLDPGEACDDGNQDENDDCSNTCELMTPTPMFNGDGGGGGGGQSSSADTSLCGDNKIDPGEDCDNGALNGAQGATCSSECKRVQPVVSCGNGTINAGETCDDGNPNSGDGCSNACAIEEKFRCTGTPSACVSYNAYVKTLSTIKDTDSKNTRAAKAFNIELDLMDTADKTYDLIKKYDINNDGKVDDVDIEAIRAELAVLAPE